MSATPYSVSSAAAVSTSNPPVLGAQSSRQTNAEQPKRRRWGRVALWSLLVLLVVGVGLIARYDIDKTLTDEDRRYIQQLLPGVAEGAARDLPFEAQVALVERSQEAIWDLIVINKGIPENQLREPKQLVEGRQGLCYDRSRVQEKMMMYLGFDTRHVALFEREPGVASFKTLFFHHVESHAISEVRTQKGWMVVDSNKPWLGLDQQRNPLSMEEINKRYANNKTINFVKPVLPLDRMFYSKSCVYAYGLYSRHGRFYAPYTSYIPDYKVEELFYNL